MDLWLDNARVDLVHVISRIDSLIVDDAELRQPTAGRVF
jgi:hypothetical protein